MDTIQKLKKKRKIYLIIMIVCGVLLLADCVLFVMGGRRSGGGDFTPGNRAEGFNPGNMPEGFDKDSMPEGFDPGNMPEGFDKDNMPEGFDKDSMPEGFDKDSMPEGFDKDSMPEGFNPENMPNGFGPSKKGGVLRIVSLIAGILLLVLEIILIILFVGVNRRIKSCSQEEQESLQTEDEKKKSKNIDLVQQRKRKEKREKIILVVVLIMAVVLVVVLMLLGRDSTTGTGLQAKESVKETSAETGSISKTIKGSGILAATEQNDVSIPGNISITKYFVSDGDFVKAGDVLAAVDQNSVQASIGEIDTMLSKIDKKMMEVKEDSISTALKAPGTSRVVAVYAKEDDSVVDVMYEKGALMLLSLDGRYAVDIENDGSLTVDTVVEVADSKGEVHEGMVSGIEKDKVTITVSMDDFTLDETVTVQMSGKESKGQLYVANELKVTGYSGTISEINVKEGDEVAKNDSLIILKNTDYTAEYQSLLEKRVKLVNQYNTLVEIANSGYIFASEEGTISNINDMLLEEEESADKEAAEQAMNSAAKVEKTVSGKASDSSVAMKTGFSTMAYSTKDIGASLVGYGISNTRTQSGWLRLTGTSSESNVNTEESNENEDGAEAVAPVETISKTVNMVWLDQNNTVTDENLPASVTVELLADEIVIQTVELNADNNWSYTWTNLPKYNAQQEISYSIRHNEIEGYKTTWKTEGSVTLFIHTRIGQNSSDDNTKPNPDENPSENTKPNPEDKPRDDANQNKPSNQNPQNKPTDSNQNPSKPGDNNANPNAPSAPGDNNANPNAPSAPGDNNAGPNAPANPGDNKNPGNQTPGQMPPSTNGGVTGFTGETTQSQQQAEEAYELEETVCCNLTPNKQISISVKVDELDISAIHVGQNCEITLDALLGQHFEGTVVKCNPTAENNGGNTKYTVTVNMDKTDEMLLGMNASVSILVEKKDNILLLPENALVEQDGHTYVYTKYDEKKDELSELTEVTTLDSDGTNVEITEGITGSQKVYYRYAGTLELE